MISDSAGEKLANSVALTLVARGAIIFATAIGLPFGGWMMTRAVDAVDRMQAKVDVIRDQSFETNSTVKLIQQTQNATAQILADHELRVRRLEDRVPRPPPPSAN